MARARPKRQPGEVLRFKRADRDVVRWRKRLERALREAAPSWTNEGEGANYCWGVLLDHLFEIRGNRFYSAADSLFVRPVDETLARELDGAWHKFGIRVRFEEDSAARRVIFTIR